MRLLTGKQVDEKLGESSPTTKWRKAKKDRFPLPVKDGGENRWVDHEIDAYQHWRVALRDGATTIEKWSEWWRAEREASTAQPDSQAAA